MCPSKVNKMIALFREFSHFNTALPFNDVRLMQDPICTMVMSSMTKYLINFFTFNLNE